MVKMDDFLLEYYRRLHFRNMPIEQFVQFCGYVDNKDYNGNMKEWAESLLEKDAATGEYVKNGKLYVAKSLPDPEEIGGDWELSSDEWIKLFKAFQNTFRAMDANKSSFKHNDKANKFLEQYFGDATKLFSHPTASPEAEAQIQLLQQLLIDNPGIEQRLQGYWNDDFSWKDLKDGLADKKYNTNPKFLKNLQRIAGQIASDLMYDMDFKNNLTNLPKNLDLYAIQDPDRFENAGINVSKLDSFKMQCPALLKELYKNSKAYEAFAANDNSKISKKLEEAKGRIKYEDEQSDDYVPPKREDELSLAERVAEQWDTTYSEYLEKYVKLRGDRLYFSPQAKNIVAAIDKVKIKPTEGLTKVIKQANDVKDKIKSATARKHFDWFSKTMGKLESTMPKAFAGALKNGRQMRAIVEEMIMVAVRDGKVDEAKTALEVLSVIKYGYTTSKVMDALNNEKFTLLSDKGLSWNKNAGIQFVTTAMDKSIKTALMGVGYGITMIGNAINLSGSKFKGRRGRLETAQQDWEQQTLTAYQDIQAQQTSDQNTRDSNQQTLDDMNRRLGINATNIDTHRQNLAQSQQREQRYNDLLQKAHDKQANLQNQIQAANDELTNLNNTLTQVNNALVQAGARVTWLQSEIANPATPPANIANYQNELNYLQTAQIPHLRNQYTQVNDQITDKGREITRLQNSLANMPNVISRINNSITNQARANQRDEIRINAWTDAQDTVAFLTDRINKRDETIRSWDEDHKDKYKELMAYWDMLETGRNTHMGQMYSWMPGKKKDAQKDFDAGKDLIISDHLSRYAYR